MATLVLSLLVALLSPREGQEMEGGANCQGQGVAALCGLSHREGVLGGQVITCRKSTSTVALAGEGISATVILATLLSSK